MPDNFEVSSEWRKAQAEVFWGEIAPCDHVLHIYEDEPSFINLLSHFVAGGLTAGDGVIVVASLPHRQALVSHLKLQDVHINKFLNTQYFPLDMDESLSRFMVNGMPDESLFMNFVSTAVRKARARNRKVRVFGEMVARLWSSGNQEGTIRLEELWNKFCGQEMLSLFCAYPKNGFSNQVDHALNHICHCHSKIVHAPHSRSADIIYSRVGHKQIS